MLVNNHSYRLAFYRDVGNWALSLILILLLAHHQQDANSSRFIFQFTGIATEEYTGQS